MRLRKPWVRTRRRLCGWNVRFTKSLLISQNRRTLTALPGGVKRFAGPGGRSRANPPAPPVHRSPPARCPALEIRRAGRSPRLLLPVGCGRGRRTPILFIPKLLVATLLGGLSRGVAGARRDNPERSYETISYQLAVAVPREFACSPPNRVIASRTAVENRGFWVSRLSTCSKKLWISRVWLGVLVSNLLDFLIFVKKRLFWGFFWAFEP